MYFLKAKTDYLDNLDGTFTLQEKMTVVLDDCETVTVPKGYTCDASSVPRAFWRICGYPSHYNNIRAGFLHDWLYGKKYQRKYGTRKTRKWCDDTFRQALICEGKSSFISRIMYWGVRIGGRSHYDH